MCILNIGLMKCGRVQWQKVEETRKDFNIVLIRQDKKFFISELFKVIEGAIPLSLHYRTMSWSRTVSSSTFITLDVQSIYIPSSIQDWYREAKIWAKDRQCSFCLWIPWTKNTRILRRSTWKHRVLHGTYIKHGKTSKHGVSGRHQTCSKEGIKVLSDTIERHHSSRNTPNLLLYPEKMFGWKLEKPFTKRYMNHLECLRRFPWDMIGWRNWCSTSRSQPTKPTKP